MPEFEVEEWLVVEARRIAVVEEIPFQEALRRAFERLAARWDPDEDDAGQGK